MYYVVMYSFNLLLSIVGPMYYGMGSSTSLSRLGRKHFFLNPFRARFYYLDQDTMSDNPPFTVLPSLYGRDSQEG